MVDPRATELTFELGNREVVVHQSPGLLNSERPAGTTGATVWKITPFLAQLLVQPSNLLWKTAILHSNANVVELGCGISGLLGLALSPLVSSYTLTDQEYVMRALRKNLAANEPQPPRKFLQKQGVSTRKPQADLHTTCLDWEKDSVLTLSETVADLDLVIASDCIYNDFLIAPFVSTCAEICCSLECSSKPAVVLVAQQLRSEEVLEQWLEKMRERFHVWRVTDAHLPLELRDGSGYVLYICILKKVKSTRE